MSFCALNVFLPWDFILSSKFQGYSTSSKDKYVQLMVK